MRSVSSWTRKLVVILAVFTAPIMPSAAVGQDKAQIRIVPNIPHSLSIQAVAISSDGKHLVSGGGDKTIKLWDMVTGRLLRTLEGHTDDVRALAFSPDGTMIASGGGNRDETIRLWKTASGEPIRSWKAHNIGVNSVAFSPDGASILSAGDISLHGREAAAALVLWNASTGQSIRALIDNSEGVVSASFSRNGKFIASASKDNTLQLWDAGSGQLIRNFGKLPDRIGGVAISPDGTRLLSSNRDRRALHLWDVETGQLLRNVLTKVYATSVAFSPDGATFLGGGPRGAELWDAESGSPLQSFTDHELPVNDVAFPPDGKHVVTVADVPRLWDAATGKLARIFGESEPVLSVAFSPDGSQLLSGSGDKTLKLWDAVSGQLTRTFTGHTSWVRSVTYSSDGTRALSGSDDKTVMLWDVASGKPIRTMNAHKGGAASVAFSPDGTQLLSGSSDRTVKLWNAANGDLVRSFEEHSAWVWSVAFSPDGTKLLSGADIGTGDATFKLWDVASGQVTQSMKLPDMGTRSVAISRDGTRLLSGSDTGVIQMRDPANGQLTRLIKGHAGPIGSVAFSPDGTRLLTASWDRTIKLWDAANGALIGTFEGHQGWVNAIAFSPDGSRVLSGSSDTTMRLWNTATSELLATLLTDQDGEWLVITPEGFFDASANGAKILTIVRGLELFSIDQFYQTLYRPDLVREKLAGDPQGKLKDAAAKVDLAKVIDSGSAPHVEIVSHRAQDRSTTDLVTLEARLSERGGGVGRAEWRINGVTVGVAEQIAATREQPANLKQTIALDPGENVVELTAYNGAGLVASAPARATITWTGKEPTAPPRLFVMAVGINDYADSALKLTYAVPDASALAMALTQTGENHYQEVIVTKVLDRDATAAKLDTIFSELAAKIRPRDVFIFFAAGHGKTHDGRYYFVPYDMRYQTEQSLVSDAIGQDSLQAWFARIPARKAVLLFDTCEAGTLAETGVARRGLEQKAALGRLIQATGRATLTASTASQAAYEGHGGHGVFTFALLDALARADTNSNGLIELAELIQHVDGLVPAITERRWGAKQFPQMDAYGSNFALARQVAGLTPEQGEAMIIPTKPTHVSTEAVSLFQDKGDTASATGQLQPFTVVTVVKHEPGWLLVAREGRLLGYAPEAKLHKLN